MSTIPEASACARVDPKAVESMAPAAALPAKPMASRRVRGLVIWSENPDLDERFIQHLLIVVGAALRRELSRL
jgi:hypothetical protein